MNCEEVGQLTPSFAQSDLGQSLRYLATNENLLAIRHGLDLKPWDEVLSVASAGDQAFAMLEVVKTVVVVDSNPRQLAYVERQIELIRNRDFLSFRKPHLLLQSDSKLGFEVSLLESFNEVGLRQRERFFVPARLEVIREKIGKVTVSEQTVLGALEGRSFTKAYLTNIIGYQDSDFTQGSLLFAGVNHLAVDGLLYISNACVHQNFLPLMNRLGLEIDKELTAVARSLEPNWKPDIFRRIR